MLKQRNTSNYRNLNNEFVYKEENTVNLGGEIRDNEEKWLSIKRIPEKNIAYARTQIKVNEWLTLLPKKR